MTDKPKTRVVEIDFEIHQMIELEKRGFDESDNDALRRLLRLPEPQPSNGKGYSWSSHGVTLPHGTELRMNYGGQELTGIIDNGEWLVGKERCNSPSRAALLVARTSDGRPAILNGWEYWYVKRPSDTSWISIASLRRRASK